MNSHLRHRLMAVMVAGAIPLAAASVGAALAQNGSDPATNADAAAPKLELTREQKSAIYQAVSKDKSKVAPRRFSAAVGADVPPMIELYALPDDILVANPTTKFYKYTVVEDRVVLVDPTNMRVVAVIGPQRLE